MIYEIVKSIVNSKRISKFLRCVGTKKKFRITKYFVVFGYEDQRVMVPTVRKF